MTWEEHEKEYGIVLTDIPDSIRIHDTIENDQWFSTTDGYAAACGRCDHLTWEFQDLFCFTPVRVSNAWYCICNDDLYSDEYDEHGNRKYQRWAIDRIIL